MREINRWGWPMTRTTQMLAGGGLNGRLAAHHGGPQVLQVRQTEGAGAP
jgi:hypothetical protein